VDLIPEPVSSLVAVKIIEKTIVIASIGISAESLPFGQTKATNAAVSYSLFW